MGRPLLPGSTSTVPRYHSLEFGDFTKPSWQIWAGFVGIEHEIRMSLGMILGMANKILW